MASNDDPLGMDADHHTGTARNGVTVRVPNKHICKLSYYTKCVTRDIGLDIVGDDGLLDYHKAHYLSLPRRDELIRIATEILNPTNIVGKLIFEDGGSGLCGTSPNKFFDLIHVQDKIPGVQRTAMIDGQERQVQKIMVFKQSWLEQYYHHPNRYFMSVRFDPPPGSLFFYPRALLEFWIIIRKPFAVIGFFTSITVFFLIFFRVI